jgi:hypothetical protein
LSFRPSKCQAVLLERLLGACCEVYNAGLQERRDAWRIQAKSIRVYDQFNQITFLRGVRDDVLVWGIQPLRGALRRLDEAYGAFYRRCAAGLTPGHPRFKSRRRFDTVCWDEPTSWALDAERGLLRIQGVGNLVLSKSARRQPEPLTRTWGGSLQGRKPKRTETVHRPLDCRQKYRVVSVKRLRSRAHDARTASIFCLVESYVR